MKKVFTYFVEPASYTLDLIKNVHSKLDISFVFINSKSEAMSDILIKKDFFLSERSIYEKIAFVYPSTYSFWLRNHSSNPFSEKSS